MYKLHRIEKLYPMKHLRAIDNKPTHWGVKPEWKSQLSMIARRPF